MVKRFSYLLLTRFELFSLDQSICKDYKKTLWTRLITASMKQHIKVTFKKEPPGRQPSVIKNNQCLTGKRYFWGLNIFLIQNRPTIFGFVLPCRQLIVYRFLGFLGIHYHQFECRQKVKTDRVSIISFNYFTGLMKKVIYIFHGNGNSFNMIFITIL